MEGKQVDKSAVMVSSHGRLTPYNDQNPVQIQKVNNLMESNSNNGEDDAAIYVEKRDNARSNERSRNDTIPEEATISMDDLQTDGNEAQKNYTQ